MKKINKYIISIYILIFIFILLSLTIFLPKMRILYYNFINPFFWLILFLISLYLSRGDIVKKRYKYDYAQIVFISVMVYLIIYYLFGLFTGYSNLPYNHSFLGILMNLWSNVLILVFQEYVRQVLINRSGNKTRLLIIITGIYTACSIINLGYGYQFSDVNATFKFIYVIFIGEFAKNILLSYLTYKSNFIPAIVYSLLLQLPVYLLPITPNFNWFLEGSFRLLLPFFIFILCSKFYEKKERIKSRRSKKAISLMPLLVIIIPMLLLVSGVLKYQMMAVASNSMYPIFERGDALIYEKLSNEELDEIKENDVIVFTRDNVVVFHRVIRIESNGTTTKHYITKGDNNNTEDTGYITKNDILGIYKFSIRFLGFPSVWLQELIG